MKTVSYFYSDPVDFSSYNLAEGGYLVEHSDAREILQNNFQLYIDNSRLFHDMKSWIDFNKTWADQKAMYGEGHYKRPEFWSHCCFLVKRQARLNVQLKLAFSTRQNHLRKLCQNLTNFKIKHGRPRTLPVHYTGQFEVQTRV